MADDDSLDRPRRVVGLLYSPIVETIYKYHIRITDVQTCKLPAGAQILSVKMLNEQLFIWAIIDVNEAYKEYREIRILGTAHPIAPEELIGYQFLDTIVDQREPGTLIWHIFVADPASQVFKEA